MKITKEDWMFEGGETNPDLLKLKHPKRDRTTYRYYKLREHGQPEGKVAAVPESATEAALRRWREEGVLI